MRIAAHLGDRVSLIKTPDMEIEHEKLILTLTEDGIEIYTVDVFDAQRTIAQYKDGQIFAKINYPGVLVPVEKLTIVD